ncbi:MAG TPA: hypothetical protein VJ996_03615 [Solirubrobacteraceae bacterium]|nr:hypothetical protein [Solirubrobacteraceae bacterium]
MPIFLLGVLIRFGSMARTAQRFEMGGNEVVLGLLIERPGTRYQLESRLKERFGSAQFGRGTANQAMKRLAERGLVRVVDGQDAVAVRDTEVAGGVVGAVGSPKTTYEATPAGVEYFSRWVRASVSTPPVREELHAKIALCGPDDLPEMIEIVRSAEAACMVRLRGLNWRIQDERQETGPQDWKRRMSIAGMAGDAAWWGGRIKWLQDVRSYLEKERQRHEASRPPTR